jgi:2'-5' RNA ligase
MSDLAVGKKLRLFIALGLDEKTRSFVADIVSEIKNRFRGEIRFLPAENWHFTVTFLGYQNVNDLPKIESAITAALENFKSPIIVSFQKLCYGPLGGTPRMIWLTTKNETSLRIKEMKIALENNLEKLGVQWQKESREYQGHLTLARFEPKRKTQLPFIDRIINWHYPVTSLDLMQSTLRQSGAVYEKLAQFDFS